ncbi:MAG: helix-turn-helix domain-containing protein, partial [Egibacteraceae bacterium]
MESPRATTAPPAEEADHELRRRRRRLLRPATGGHTAARRRLRRRSRPPARDACEPVAMHAVWSRRTNEHLAGLGLDFLTSYVWGRAAHLGEPVGAVVASSFAWFEPGLVTALYDAARAAVPRDRLAGARGEAEVASLSEVLSYDDKAGGVADLLAGAAKP